MSTGGCFDTRPCCTCPCCPYRRQWPETYPSYPWWEYRPSNPWNPTWEYYPPYVTCGTDNSSAPSDVQVTVTFAAPEQEEPSTPDAPEVKDVTEEERERQFIEFLEESLRVHKAAWERLAKL